MKNFKWLDEKSVTSGKMHNYIETDTKTKIV